MKKLSLLLMLLVVGVFVIALASCADVEKPFDISPAPETTPYQPPSLNIEFFDESDYSGMTAFQKYPVESSETQPAPEYDANEPLV